MAREIVTYNYTLHRNKCRVGERERENDEGDSPEKLIYNVEVVERRGEEAGAMVRVDDTDVFDESCVGCMAVDVYGASVGIIFIFFMHREGGRERGREGVSGVKWGHKSR